MVDKPEDIETIYNAARKKTSEAERSAYLDAVCGDDSALRARVEELLKAQDEIGDFLESPPVGSNVTVDRSAHMEGPGTIIGHYELLELIGEGGMGLVYLAEQKEPVRRKVVLKIVKPGMDSKQVIARFEAERQALAVLDHPNIAHVFDAGTTETGRPYFVMEYVKGMSITRYCDEKKLNIEQRLRLFEQVCEGVQHADQKGIIHRDLKPSNILVSVHGDRPVPKIIDFGIAKAITQPLTEKTFVTFQGQLLGTPEYMSPEQVDLATQDIDTRSDIYSLGVVLYELLAGVLPFEKESFARAGFAEIQRTIRESEPASPSIRLTGLGEKAKTIAASRGTQVVPLARRLHRELEWIPLKAMRKDRCRRYKSASDMADDIRNYLNGNPLIAGPETATYRVQKFVHKHAGSVVTAALVAAAIVLGLIVSTTMYFRAEDARQKEAVAREQAEQATKKEAVARTEAEGQRQRAEASEEHAQNLLYAANMNLAQQAWEQDNVGRLRQLLEETASYPQRGFEWCYWQRQAHLELRTFRGHSDVVWSVAFCPDGKRIVTGSSDATAKVWEVDSGRELLTLKGHSLGILSVAFSPDGQRIVTGGEDETARVWETDSGKELLVIRADNDGVCSVTFSPDGQRIVTGGFDATAKVWEAATGKELLSLQGHAAIVWSAVFSPDGQRIATSSDDATAKIWDANNGRELRTLRGHGTTIWSVEFSRDGQRIVTGSWDGIAKVWDADSGKELLSVHHPRGIASVVFSPDGQRIVTSSDDATAKVWEASTGKELLTFKGHSHVILSLAFSPDGRQIVTGSGDQTAKVWEATSGEKLMSPEEQTFEIRSAAFSSDSQRMVTGHFDGTAKVWDVKGGKELFTLQGHNGQIWAVAFSQDGQQIVTSDLDGRAKVWDATGGKELLSLKGHSGPIFAVAFSPDGKQIVTGSHDATAKVWETNSGNELLTLKWHDGPIQSVAFSPDGRRIVTGSRDKTAKVWEVDSGKELLTLEGHSGTIYVVAFSPDGQRIVTGGRGATVKVWEASTGKELLTFRGHSSGLIRCVAFSSDNQRVCTGGNDTTAKIWEVANGKELLSLKGHSGPIFAVAFSPDGKRIVIGSHDATAKIWEAASLEQVASWQQEEKADTEWRVALQREQAAVAERDKTLRAQDPGAIKQWLVLAPLAFDGQDDAAALTALDQQQLPKEAAIHPRAGERVKIGEIERTWEAVQQQDNLIDFNRLLGEPTNYSIAYTVCYVDSQVKQTDLMMKIGSGDPLKVYLNGQEIHQRERAIQNYIWSEADVTGLKLKAGLNVLMLKVVNLVGDWRGSVWLADSTGQPVKGIRVTLEPPEEAQQ